MRTEAKHIAVTAEDIANGEPNEPCMCPVARAIERAFPGSTPWVHPAEVGIADLDVGGGDVEARLPAEAVNFIYHFDMGLPVEPFEFELQVSA